MTHKYRPIEVTKDVFCVGALDPDLQTFDLVMPLEKGTTYNSYLILDEKKTLVDIVKAGFGDQLMGNLAQIIDPSDLDYIVINHFEQDHTGFLIPLLEVAKNACLIISKNASSFLLETFNRDLPNMTVVDGTEISLGERTLRFYRTPFLHWPDTMVEFLIPDGILFTCDAFGFHYCELDEEKTGKADWNLRYYYDLIMRPFREHVAEAVGKIEGLDIKILCPSHGPIRRNDPAGIISSYREWSRGECRFDNPTVLLVYASFYKNTARIAEEIGRGLEGEGVDVRFEDISRGLEEGVKDRAEDACGLILGTPTMAGSPIFYVWDLFKELSVISRKGKPAATFGSYGWNAMGIKIADDVLKNLRFKVDLEPLKIRLTPTEEDLGKALRFGKDFAGCVQKFLQLKRPGP